MLEVARLVGIYFFRGWMPGMALAAAWEHETLAMACFTIAALIAWAQKP